MIKEKWKQIKQQFFDSNSEVRIESVCVTHLGKVRLKNEDNFYYDSQFLPMVHNGKIKPIEWNYSTKRLQAMAVFDGMGGESAGDLASFTSASQFHKRYSELSKCKLMPTEEQITELLIQISNAVHDTAKKERYKLIGATATIFFLKDEIGMLANLGDSPMYRMRDGKLSLVSHPHTNAELLNRQGIKRKPGLTQFLGIDGREFVIEPYIRKIHLKEEDQYLLCSDGLTDMVADEEIEEVLKSDGSVKEKVNILLKLTLERGAKDNTTIILSKVNMT